MKLRIYSETVAYEALLSKRTLALLARYDLELVLAVRPWHTEGIVEVARALADHGVTLSIWPMLSDDAGRWASVHNAEAFARLTSTTCAALEGAGTPPRDVLFDLEPPFAQAKTLAALASDPSARSSPALARLAVSRGKDRLAASRFAVAGGVLAETIRELGAHGIGASTAVWPMIALDKAGERGWQALLGTPVDDLGVAHVSIMMYTSMLEGWSYKTLRRTDALDLLGAATARAVRRWGEAAGVSLGCVGVGAFEDEPTYRNPTELAEDVAVVRAFGCDHLTLFDLGGVLARPPAEGWLDAFTAGAEIDDDRGTSKRVRAARIVARAASWALARGPRRRP